MHFTQETYWSSLPGNQHQLNDGPWKQKYKQDPDAEIGNSPSILWTYGLSLQSLSWKVIHN